MLRVVVLPQQSQHRPQRRYLRPRELQRLSRRWCSDVERAQTWHSGIARTLRTLRTAATIPRVEMKRRSFLLPLALSLAALAAVADGAAAKPVIPTTISLPSVVLMQNAPMAPNPLVLKRANGTTTEQHARHYSHRSHSSHSSHYSHRSHYSSR